MTLDQLITYLLEIKEQVENPTTTQVYVKDSMTTYTPDPLMNTKPKLVFSEDINGIVLYSE